MSLESFANKRRKERTKKGTEESNGVDTEGETIFTPEDANIVFVEEASGVEKASIGGFGAIGLDPSAALGLKGWESLGISNTEANKALGVEEAENTDKQRILELEKELLATQKKLVETENAKKKAEERAEKEKERAEDKERKELAATGRKTTAKESAESKEIAVSSEDRSGKGNKGDMISHESLLVKAEQIFREQVFLSGDSGKENNISNIELAKAKGNSFLDGLGNVTAIKHELQLIEAEKEHGFKRIDELKILNSLRRVCELSAKVCERDIMSAYNEYERLFELKENGMSIDEERFMYLRNIIRSCMSETKDLIGSTGSLLQLERKSGSKPWGARSSKPVSVNYISGLIESKRKEETDMFDADFEMPGGGARGHGEWAGKSIGYGKRMMLEMESRVGTVKTENVEKLLEEMEEELSEGFIKED